MANPLPSPETVPLLATLEIQPIAAAGGESKLKMRVSEKHLRSLGILHGGATATLLDTALGYAVMSVVSEGQHAVTAQLNVNFIRPASEGDLLEATGHVVHRGRQTAVANGEVRTAGGALVATATGTFLFVPLP